MVNECGLSPEYVLDKMQMYEIRPLIKGSYRRNKDSWEQARLIAYIIAQVNSTKQIKPTEILQFSWEDETGTAEKDTSISNADVARLREKAKQFEQKGEKE